MKIRSIARTSVLIAPLACLFLSSCGTSLVVNPVAVEQRVTTYEDHSRQGAGSPLLGLLDAPQSAVDDHLVLGMTLRRADYRRGFNLILRTDLEQIRANGSLKFDLPGDEIRMRLADGRLALAVLEFDRRELRPEDIQNPDNFNVNSPLYVTPNLSAVAVAGDGSADSVEGRRLGNGRWDVTSGVKAVIDAGGEEVELLLSSSLPVVPDDGLLEGAGPLRDNERRRIRTRWLEHEIFRRDAGDTILRIYRGYHLYGPFELKLFFN